MKTFLLAATVVAGLVCSASTADAQFRYRRGVSSSYAYPTYSYSYPTYSYPSYSYSYPSYNYGYRYGYKPYGYSYSYRPYGYRYGYRYY